jgi:RNA polymerase sigma-70 factor (ECF subfamily)
MLKYSDEELVRLVQDGEVFAFEQLVKRYQQKLLGFVYHMIRDVHAADDIVQEAFINLYKTIDRVDSSKKFSAYVFSIARNTTISHIRKNKKDIPLDDILASNEEESLYAQIVQAEQAHTIEGALAKIPVHYQKVIRLYYFEDLSYEEVSKKLSLPVNTIRTHLRRGKELLRKLLSYEKN